MVNLARKRVFPWIVFVVCWSFLLGIQSPVRASTDSESIQLTPTFQEVLLLDSVAQMEVKIEVTNNTENDQEFEVSVFEIQQFDSDGKVIFSDKPSENQPNSVSDFIIISPRILTVAKNTTVSLPVVVQNLPELSPGGHYASIVAQMRAPESSNQQVLPAVSSFLLIQKKGGERYHISLQELTLGTKIWWSIPDQVSLTFQNQGNIHVIPRGSVEVFDIFDRRIAKSSINENSYFVFPGTQRSISQTFLRTHKPWPISLFQLRVTGRSQPGDVLFEQSHWVFYLNLVEIFVIGIFLTLLSLAGYYLWKRRKRFSA